MSYAKKFEVEVTVPAGLKAGDKFNVTVEAPELPKQARGQLNGLTLEEMTDDQLKVELINSKSVLYKAKKRGADQATIDANQARVDAAEAEKAKRHPVTVAPVAGSVVTEGPVDEGSASEM